VVSRASFARCEAALASRRLALTWAR
jgi:hypothetical protein